MSELEVLKEIAGNLNQIDISLKFLVLCVAGIWFSSLFKS